MDGDIAMDNTRILQDHMDRILQDGCHHLVLNFENVPFVSSRGIGILASTYTLVNLNEGALCVAGANRDIDAILRRIKFDTLLHLAPDEEAGIRIIRRLKTLKDLELDIDEREGLVLLRFARPLGSLERPRFHELVAELVADRGALAFDLEGGELLSPQFAQGLRALADGVSALQGRVPVLCHDGAKRRWLVEQGPLPSTCTWMPPRRGSSSWARERTPRPISRPRWGACGILLPRSDASPPGSWAPSASSGPYAPSSRPSATRTTRWPNMPAAPSKP